MVRRHQFILLGSIISINNSNVSAQRFEEDDTDEEEKSLTEISPWIPITIILTIAVGLIIYCIVKRLRKQQETHNDLNAG